MKPAATTLGVIAALVIAGAAFAFFTGVFGTGRATVTHPPCDTLPTRAEAFAALARHPDLVAEITALGEDITVDVHNPCPDDADRGLIRVTYSSPAEYDAITELIARRDGFGVPLYVVSR